MDVVEEPFLTRDDVLAVLRPVRVSGMPWMMSAQVRAFASSGIRVEVRTEGGQVLAPLHLYSALNADAMRAARRRHFELARQLAKAASELEKTSSAAVIRDQIQSLAGLAGPQGPDWELPVELRRYLAARERFEGRVLERNRLVRDWLARSTAWLHHGDHPRLVEALMTLTQRASELRRDILSGAHAPATTFFGVVRRMNGRVAELEGQEGRQTVPRDDLERHGLAVLGQAVALLHEALPSGGALLLPLPAIRLEDAPPDPYESPYARDDVRADGGVRLDPLSPPDWAWFQRDTDAAVAAPPTGLFRRSDG